MLPIFITRCTQGDVSMEIRQLQYFVESARRKSFSQAARFLYTTQPNISKSIQKLEAELQIELFVRGNVGVELTPEGQVVYEHARMILNNVAEMETLIQECQKKNNGGQSN